VMALVKIAEQCLDPRPEGPSWLQASRIAADRPLPSPGTGHHVLLRFDHHRRERRQISHLTPPDSPTAGQRRCRTPPDRRSYPSARRC
jgi:hypothetical protein